MAVYLGVARAYQSGTGGQRLRVLHPPKRALTPPFPDGPCGGTVVTLPLQETHWDGANPLSGTGALMLPPRPILVWLPPDYEAGPGGIKKNHPVLYCHDGQNAIDDASSWTGSSWRLAGALTRLAERNLLRPLKDDGTVSPVPIVVLLPSADGDLIPGVRRRHLEYGDTSNAFAKAHVDFVSDTIKPLVDSLFRTVPTPEGTFSLGSSMGGQASLHMLIRRPDLYGGAAALSPCFNPATIASVVGSARDLRSKVLYFDNGGDSDDRKVPLFDAFDHLTPHHWWNPGYFWLDTQLQPGINTMMLALDLGGVTYRYQREPGARHNERAWARRIDKPLVHLFGWR